MQHRMTPSDASANAATDTPFCETQLKHKRRYCRAEGCSRIVKSQGLCQRHGAKPKKCKVDGCSKQAQGNFGGMCKLHFKSSHPPTEEEEPRYCAPVLTIPTQFSIYDRCLPALNKWNDRKPAPRVEQQQHQQVEDELYDVQPLDLWDAPSLPTAFDAACIEALAAELIDFSPKRHQRTHNHHNRLLSFEGFGEEQSHNEF